tara:strand:- start:40 stop:636 length:597 start_codon:yes stop_codon:yes gene_type:complete
MPYIKQIPRGKESSKMLGQGGRRPFFIRDRRDAKYYTTQELMDSLSAGALDDIKYSSSAYPMDTLAVPPGDVEATLSEMGHQKAYSREFIEETLLKNITAGESFKDLIRRGFYSDQPMQDLSWLRVILGDVSAKELEKYGDDPRYTTPNTAEWIAHEIYEPQEKDRLKAIIDSLLQKQSPFLQYNKSKYSMREMEPPN